nr:hypothetical protein CFP56_74890 [Quercus suber]
MEGRCTFWERQLLRVTETECLADVSHIPRAVGGLYVSGRNMLIHNELQAWRRHSRAGAVGLHASPTRIYRHIVAAWVRGSSPTGGDMLGHLLIREDQGNRSVLPGTVPALKEWQRGDGCVRPSPVVDNETAGKNINTLPFAFSRRGDDGRYFALHSPTASRSWGITNVEWERNCVVWQSQGDVVSKFRRGRCIARVKRKSLHSRQGVSKNMQDTVTDDGRDSHNVRGAQQWSMKGCVGRMSGAF